MLGVQICMPKSMDQGYINNQKELYSFMFDGVLPHNCKQDEVFDRLAAELLLGTLEGVNATIFAYGQTGSGKTFTITGGPERYADRGLIPRSISFLFHSIAQRPTFLHKVGISYLEIYNEAGYDLLAPAEETRVVEDLPRVHIMEDEDGRLHMRNLSLHAVASEEEALNLLFLGETNRTISETPMNMASSRSHCIFTLHIESRQVGQEVIKRSKMHLVDLAGSERVSKTRILGTVLSEAKHINLSLHFLEQVIISLQERGSGQGRAHIPFRNSMLTTALRDSLGGNCRTVMVANVAATADQAEETISTCRFAQRVAMIGNSVTANEEMDPAVLVRMLQQEVKDLKQEIRLLKASQDGAGGALTAQHYTDLSTAMAAYLADPSLEASLDCGGDMRLIRSAMAMMKAMIQKPLPPENAAPAAHAVQPATWPVPEDIQQQLSSLQSQIEHRDSEIRVLMKMLHRPAGEAVHNSRSLSVVRGDMAASCVFMSGKQQSSTQEPWPDLEVIADRERALQYWEEHHFDGSALQENKQALRQHYREAKQLGDKLDSGKETITRLRTELQSKSSCAGDDDSTAASHKGLDELVELRENIQQESGSYREALDRLRMLKPAIEHLQLLIEKGQTSKIAKFDAWHALMQLGSRH
ncbi:g13535 [Coccomyxa viridis]|uniref:Kinesin-like protein n=1 Tax=Coccomyxa viridis TaxID=1274662 RepID=A0ABP1GIF8_9CHLO